MLKILTATVLALGLGGTALAQGAGGATPEPGDVGRGHTLFMSAGCYECHGTVGQGGVGLKLAPDPLPTAAVIAYLRDPSGEMPPYTSAVLSDAQIGDIHAYLASIPAPPKVADITLLTLPARK